MSILSDIPSQCEKFFVTSINLRFFFSFTFASYRLSELRIKKFLRLNKNEKEIGA